MSSTSDETVCRLCANPGHNYQSIFDENANSIVDKIHNCLPLVVDANDQLPTHICSPCHEALNISDHLRTQCIRADALLRKQVKVVLVKGIKQEPEDPLGNEEDELESNFDEIKAYKEVINLGRPPGWSCEYCKEEFKSDNDFREHECEERPNENENVEDEEENSEDSDDLTEANGLEDPLDVVQEILPHSGDKPGVDSLKSRSRCDICSVTIKDKELMELHVKFHQSRPMFCSYCHNTFPSPYELYIHKKLVHKKWTTCLMKWFCERCETITSSVPSVRRHLTQCTKKMFSCKYCHQEFAYRLDFISHQKKNHYDLMLDDPSCVKFKCDICDKRYVDKATFSLHLRRHRAVKTERYKCPYCEKNFSTRINLNNHVQAAHERRKVFECDICSKTFFNGKNMRRHKQRHNKLTCTECNAHFDSETILDEHMRSEHNGSHGRDRYPCKLCDLIFPKRRLLRDHQNVHTGERPYTCEVCNKNFQSYNARWAHLQMHRKNIFYCDYCQKRFKNKVSLKKHIPKHQAPEDWQYYCEICEVNFRNHEILKRHMEKNEDLHRRTCDVCDFEVLGTHNLRKHKSQKHDIWETTEASKTGKE